MRVRSLVALFLVFVLIFSLTACGDTNGTVPATESDENNTTIGDEKGYSEFVGVWSEPDISWDFGGVIIEVVMKGDKMEFSCSNTDAAPISRVAKFTKAVALSDLDDRAVTLNFEDDGWGGSGTVDITFAGEYLCADFKNIASDETVVVCGFYESFYQLERNENAYKAMEYTMEEYEEKYPEEDTDFYEPSQQQTTTQQTTLQPMYTFPQQTTPEYDTSKASGILASMGMTEQEFKDSCTPLRGQWIDMTFCYNENDPDSLAYMDNYDYNCGKQYFEEHPTDEVLLDAKEKWERISKDWSDRITGLKTNSDYYTNSNYYTSEKYGKEIHFYEKYGDLDTYIKEQVYASEGRQIIRENTTDLFQKMREYPNDYIGKGFVFLDMDDFSASMYTKGYLDVSIHDARDDTSNPNILFGKYDYHLYVVFTGSGGKKLNFDLIAIEKTREN